MLPGSRPVGTSERHGKYEPVRVVRHEELAASVERESLVALPVSDTE